MTLHIFRISRGVLGLWGYCIDEIESRLRTPYDFPITVKFMKILIKSRTHNFNKIQIPTFKFFPFFQKINICNKYSLTSKSQKDKE